MDYRNSIKNYDKNTIIYAHNRKDKTMFGSLDNVLTKEWFNNEENRVIKMSTEKSNTLWQIFSIYTIKTTNDYIQTKFENDIEYKEFLSLIKNFTGKTFVINTEVFYLWIKTCLPLKKRR